MTTKFNQGMYTKMRAKKNEPFSSLEKRTVHVVEKGVSIIPPTPVTEPSRIVSPTTSMEEITPLRKKQLMDNMGKDKADSRSFSIFYDAGLAVARAQDAFTTRELRVFSGMPSNEVVGRHIHKLIQVVYLCNFTLFFFFFCIFLNVGFSFQVLGGSLHITLEYLTHETKVASTVSKVEALEAENSKLKNDLISTMDEANNIKEKDNVLGDDLKAKRKLTLGKDEQLQATKKKVKTVVAKAIEAFQQTEE